MASKPPPPPRPDRVKNAYASGFLERIRHATVIKYCTILTLKSALKGYAGRDGVYGSMLIGSSMCECGATVSYRTVLNCLGKPRLLTPTGTLH